ncbi:CDP-diacylglycerol--serine O-phosphatidyltransferase [Nevskia soli]|uniref:CDP-diacylglycerol--serine O-phosphatidyltransferase n=1 Tax=Nevskia soli TaxID=418856 RepID=UPI001C5CC068|nr:CDP-diacylglycerol--serine O-phosphatidyltransferase [Nevskia soli]
MSDVEPRPRRKPTRVAYALPTAFTAGNIFLGFLAMLHSIQGAQAIGHPDAAAASFAFAAQMIGLAILLDGLDGRIARLTNTTSDFGREMDSLSDVISFGLAPALLAYTWGSQFIGGEMPLLSDQLSRAAKLITFLFLLCGSARLARFNVTKNPMPKNPGRPNRKYFVGLPIPAAAGLIAATVFAADGYPITWMTLSIVWLLLLVLLSWLMISPWRYYAFKDNAFLRPRSPLTIVLIGALIIMIFLWRQPVLLLMASTYTASGVLLRIGGIIRRRSRRAHNPPPALEQSVG